MSSDLSSQSTAVPSRNTSFFLKSDHVIATKDLPSKTLGVDYYYLSHTPGGSRIHDPNDTLMSLSRMHDLGNTSAVDKVRVERTRERSNEYGYDPQYLYFRPIFPGGTHKISDRDVVIAANASAINVFNQEIRDEYARKAFSEGESAYLKTRKPITEFSERVRSAIETETFGREKTINRMWVWDEDDDYFFGSEERVEQYLPEVILDAEEIQGVFVPHDMVPEELKE